MPEIDWCRTAKQNERMKQVLSLLLVATLAVTAWLYFHRDSFVGGAIRAYGPAILGVGVKLRSSHIDVANQAIELRDLKIENPPGYRNKYLLELKAIRVKVDISTLPQQILHIPEITLEKPEIHFEKKGGVSNFDVLQRNALRYAGVKAKSGPAANEKKFIIGLLKIEGAKATVWQDLLVAQSLGLALPVLAFRDIGKRSGGATSADITSQLLGSLGGSVAGTAAQAVGTGVGKAGKEVGKAAEGVGKEVGKGAKAVGGAIKGLFGK